MRKVRRDWHAMVSVTGLITLTVIAVGCASSPPAEMVVATDVTVFEGARLIVGDGSDPIENAVFVVDEDRFTLVGEADEVETPAGATRVDLSGRTVMPAIIDTHVHTRTVRAELVEDLERKAYYGVGAVLSLGRDDGGPPFAIRNEAISNAALFRTVGRGITSPEPGRTEVPYWITSEEEARTAVQELVAADVTMVKVWVDDRNGQFEKLSPELYGAVIDEAHARGLRVTAHIFALEDAKGLLRAGIDAFAHGIRDQDVDDEVVALFAEHPDVVLVPNMGARGVAEDLGWLAGTIPDEQVATLQAGFVDRPDVQERFGIQARNLARLNEAGVRIAFGTDGNVGWSQHLEMADMVASGMTPHEVIVAATSTSALFLGLTDAGLIVAGKSADFLVLEANPLDDITNTRRIESVYLRGEMTDRAGMSARWVARSSGE